MNRRNFLKTTGLGLAGILLGCDNEIFPGSPIEETDYLTVTIKHEDDVDLSDHGFSSAEKAINIKAPGLDRFYMNYRADRPDLPQDSITKTNEIWVAKINDGFEIFYKDIEQVPSIQHYAHIGSNNHIDLCDIIFKNNAVLLNMDFEISPKVITVNVFGNNERLDIQFKTDYSGINSLGEYKSLEEADEI